LRSLSIALLLVAMTIGPASLASAQTEANSVLLIMDASGSMNRVDDSGTPLIDGAKDALRAIVDQLPPEANVGLRVYGHRTSNEDPAAGCVDTELVVPVGRLDRDGLHEAIDSFDASGFTPIGLSLQEAAGDLPTSGSRTIILVSDGVDTCAPPDPCEVAEQLATEGFATQIHTVGFFLNDQAAVDQLGCIAEAGRGTFTQIDDLESLTSELGGLVTDAVQGQQKPLVPGALAMEMAPVILWRSSDPEAPFQGFIDSTIDAGETRWYRYEVSEEQAGTHHLVVTAVIDPQPDVLVGEYLDIQILDESGNTVGVPHERFGIPVLSPQRLDLAEQVKYADRPTVLAVTATRSSTLGWNDTSDEPRAINMRARFHEEGLNGGQFNLLGTGLELDPALGAGSFFVAVTWESSRTASSTLEVGAFLDPAEDLEWVADKPQLSLVTLLRPGDEPTLQQLEMAPWEGEGLAGASVAPLRSIGVISGIEAPRLFRFHLNEGERLEIFGNVEFADGFGEARIPMDLVDEAGTTVPPLEGVDRLVSGYQQWEMWEASLDGQYTLTVAVESDEARSEPAVLLAVFVFPADGSTSELPTSLTAALMNGLRSVRDYVADSG